MLEEHPYKKRPSMLDVIANALLQPSARIIEDCCGYYQNEKGAWGRYMTVWYAGHYHMISVSHICDVPTPEEVAKALVSSMVYLKDSGHYRNSRGALGYWATVQSGEHWYMVSVSDRIEPYHRQ
jgi:hypothetical protein